MLKKPREKPRLDADDLFQYAVKMLAGRAISTGELRVKLKWKAEKATDVDPVIARLKDYGYLDDQRFAEHFTGTRLENQGLGKARVLRDLQSRRVASTTARRVVDRAYANVDELKLIEDYVERRILKFRSGERLADAQAFAAAYRKLMRAGFNSANSVRVLKQLSKEPGMFDEFEPPEPDAEPEDS
jgi:regulatory protein